MKSGMTDYALITGSSKGLGRVLANVFSDNGYNLMIHGRNEERLLEVRDELIGKGSKVRVVSGALTDRVVIDTLAENAKELGVSVLVNNAAESVCNIPFEEIDDSFVESMVYTNLIAPILLTKKVYPYFVERGGGNIVNINSVFSLETKKNSTIYTASKHGLRGFTNALRQEARDKGIGVMEVYLTKVRLPGGTYGMDAREAAENIYDRFKNPGCQELFIEGRPQKYRPDGKDEKDYIARVEAKKKS